jgi:hypothetical protein
LKGDAQKTLHSISVSSINYELAWQTLQKQFEKKRLIMLEHVITILNSPPLVKNSHVAMRQLFDYITINIEALRTLGQEVDK